MSFYGSLLKRPKLDSREYRNYVATLPCCGCGVHGQQVAHHCIADRHGSSKHSDLFCMSLCNDCHRLLHVNWREWEGQHGAQWLHVARTIEQAFIDGVLVIDKKLAKVMANG